MRPHGLAARLASLSITNSQSLLKLMSCELVKPSNHLILCHLLLLLPSIFLRISVFTKEWLYASRGQSIGASASASVLPMSIQGWFPLGLAGWISLQTKGLSRVFFRTTKASVLQCSAFFIVQFSHLYVTTRKTIALTIRTFVGKVMSLLFNMLSRLVVAFLPRASAFSFHGFHYLWIVATSENMWLFFKSE